MNRAWWVPLTGVAFVVLVIVGGIIGGEPPSVDDPVQEIVDHYVDNKDAIIAGSLVAMIGVFFFLVFASYLRNVLRAAEDEDGLLANVAFAGAIILAVGGAIDSMIYIALAEAVEDIEPSSVQALQALWDNDWAPFVLGAGTFLLASGLSIVLNGSLPKWLGWIAIVLGVLAFTPIGFVAFIGGALWILIASIVMTIRARRATQAPARPAARPHRPPASSPRISRAPPAGAGGASLHAVRLIVDDRAFDDRRLPLRRRALRAQRARRRGRLLPLHPLPGTNRQRRLSAGPDRRAHVPPPRGRGSGQVLAPPRRRL